MSGETSRAWSWRHAFASSELPATTKAVLHTLGMFMNELGEGCYPSVSDICRYSGLDKKTVLKHLACARDAGWIAVAQHGYRGQKWKRQEYAARWPERDLVAACPPADAAEGGGAAPPPCAQKVVEQVPEGGGMEGSKVVEQLHQDKTSPETTPVTSPEAREGAPERGADRKKREARAWALLSRWPGFAGMPKDRALKAAMALDDAAFDRAEHRFDGWLALLKAQRKDHVPAPSTYFGERLFDEVPDAAAAGPAAVEPAKPFGKAGMAQRFDMLLAGPVFRHFRMTPFEQRQVDAGEVGAAELMRAKQAAQGYPNVTERDGRAAVTVPAHVAAMGDGFVQARRGDERFEDWREEHRLRGWPWLPAWVEWVWLPPGSPADAVTAMAAARNDKREAAE